MRWRHWTGLVLIVLAALFVALWLARATIAARVAQDYFRQHGVESTVEIGDLGLSGVSGRFALGPAGAPEISAERIELFFDPLRWLPRVVEVRLVHPVIRVAVDERGRPNFPTLQRWIDSLQTGGKSQFVSDDLAISLRDLRALLATPAGALDLDGDVKLVRNLPVAIALNARPTRLAYQGHVLQLHSARVDYNSAAGSARMRLSGDVDVPQMQGLEGDLAIAGLRWSLVQGVSVAASSLHLHLAARSLNGPAAVIAPVLDMTIREPALNSRTGFAASAADLKVSARTLQAAGMPVTAPAMTMAVRNLSWSQPAMRADLQVNGQAAPQFAAIGKMLAADHILAQAAASNLAHLAISFAAHVERRGDTTNAALTAPLLVTGAKGGVLRVPVLGLAGTSQALRVAAQATLSGKGLPDVRLSSRNLVWTGGGLTGDAVLTARFDYAMLRGAAVAAQGTISWQAGSFAFLPTGCMRAALAAFRPGAAVLAQDIRADLCPTGKPLLAGDGRSWQLSARAAAVAAALPGAGVRLDQGDALLSFAGKGAAPQGTVTLTTAQVSDAVTPLRFKPLLGSGTIGLKDNVWRGTLAVTDPRKAKLADVALTHNMAGGTGTAHITAANLAFAPGALQPSDLSPLLAAFRQTRGALQFRGDVDWTGGDITSRGSLGVAGLDFLTPLGAAHAVDTTIALTSLLPPVSAPHQGLKIARIDWTLPFSGVDVRFGFAPSLIQVDSVSTGIAEGHVALGAFSLNPAQPGTIQGAADLNAIALSALVTATNLGNRVKLDGKVSGHIPFSAGAAGMHIAGGHLASDGPGRLSIDRALWTQGAPAANAVQDFAYQALENLAFDSLTADLNSVANGRLQVVFHIKGRSDPPKPQTADIAVSDILNGSALQKTIPLPSGTPIDLTLDTSLNFDELLQSYTQAWSMSLHPGASQ